MASILYYTWPCNGVRKRSGFLGFIENKWVRNNRRAVSKVGPSPTKRCGAIVMAWSTTYRSFPPLTGRQMPRFSFLMLGTHFNEHQIICLDGVDQISCRTLFNPHVSFTTTTCFLFRKRKANAQFGFSPSHSHC